MTYNSHPPDPFLHCSFLRFPSGWKMLPLIVYTPLGLVLATVRIFIGLQAIVAASLLHKLPPLRGVVLRTMCAILGIVIFEESNEIRDESVKIIVTNHISLLDHLAVHLISGSTSINVCDLPSLFHFAFNYKNMGNLKEKEVLIQNIKHLIDNGVLIDVQPENAITSGQKGLLRFSSWPCSLSHPVQPASIKIWRPPLMQIMPSVMSGTWMSDIFWFLFVPFTVFTVKYLPVVKQSENESPEEMSKKLESTIANDLNVSVTNFTQSDKVEYEKRLDVKKPYPRPVELCTHIDPRLMEMAWKVKEVLPDVPMKTIFTELGKTRSVDLTISNILEGIVSYVPEQIRAPCKGSRAPAPEKRKSSLEESQPSTSFEAPAKTFPKSARDRMISFQERKLRLIESARQRYIEKHALNVMNSS